MMVVVKMRRSPHSIDLVEYQITGKGIEVGEPLRGYRGLTSGLPQPWSVESGENNPAPRTDRPRPMPKPRQRK